MQAVLVVLLSSACVFAEFTQASKVVEVIQKGDLLKSLRSLRELQPWNAPALLTHLYRQAVHTHTRSLSSPHITELQKTFP